MTLLIESIHGSVAADAVLILGKGLCTNRSLAALISEGEADKLHHLENHLHP